MATQIALENLNEWLQMMPDNTPDTAYEVEVTGLTTSNYNNLKSILSGNNTKYIDLSATYLPSGITQMIDTFYECTSLVKAPIIPTGVVRILGAFGGCTSLVESPVIPNTVDDMAYSFYGCTSLLKAPEIPYGVREISYAFYNCASLIEVPNVPSSVELGENTFGLCRELIRIDSFKIPLARLKNNSAFYNMFLICPKLKQIGYTPYEAEDWHLMYINLGTNIIQGKVYSRNGSVSEISYTTGIQKETLSLPIKTDELLFAPNLSINGIEALIEGDGTTSGIIETKYSWYIKNVIAPTGSNFLMYAKDPEKFMTNLPLGRLSIKRIAEGTYDSTSATHSLATGEKFTDWDFIIPIISLYDSYQLQFNFIPKAEIEYCIGLSSGASQNEHFIASGSTGGTDRRICWGCISDTQFKVGIRNGTSSHVGHLYGFYGVKFN